MYTCTECGKEYEKKSAYNGHIRMTGHKNNSVNFENKSKISKNQEVEKMGDTNICPSCHQSIRSQQDLIAEEFSKREHAAEVEKLKAERDSYKNSGETLQKSLAEAKAETEEAHKAAQSAVDSTLDHLDLPCTSPDCGITKRIKAHDEQVAKQAVAAANAKTTATPKEDNTAFWRELNRIASKK